MPKRRVLSVGQCGMDQGRIASVLRTGFGAEVVGADTEAEALRLLRGGSFDLVLVNRVFDADGGSGIDFIRQVKGDEELKVTPVMLVSNYADAQEQAVAAGAQPGFGKAALGSEQTAELLRGYL
jgi:two-component system chemotaxis response regulator CheY